MRIIKTLAACVAFSLLLSSCKKDDSAEQPQGCKLTRQYLYDNGVKTDSLEYTYTGNNISKVIDRNENSYHTLEYNPANKVIKQNFFEPLTATKAYAFVNVTYNSDGSLGKLEAYEVMGNTNTLVANVIYTYTGGKLASEVTNSIDNGVTEKVEEHQYTWTGNNITKDVITSYFSGSPDVETVTYTFDSKENHFKKGGLNQMFTGGIGADFGVAPLPLLLNANNVVGVNYSGFPFTLEYSVDNKANVTLIKALGQPVFGFTYTCP